MSKFAKRKRVRRVVASILLIAACASVAAVVWRRQPDATVAEAASIFKSATVTTGDMKTTERIDGTVELSSTVTVLHRIEGQTSTASTAAASNPTTQPTDSSSSNLSSSLLSTAAAVVDDCTTTDPASPAEPVAAAPAELVAVATTEPAAVAPAEPTTPDPVPSPTTPDTSPVATTAPATEPTPSSTVPTEPTCTTTPSTTPTAPTGGAPTGALPSGGLGGGGGGGGGGQTATVQVTQTITSIMSVNAQPRSGDVLYTVDGGPVIALDGALPAWRSLSTASVDGADIAQLESSLVALGYDPEAKVTVDNEFDSATRTMVKLWQEGLGVEETGEVELGSIVFLPPATTVIAVEQEVGDSVGEGDAVLQLAASTQNVVIEVPEEDQALVVPGLAVTIGDLQGNVAELRSADSDGSVVVEAVIVPASEIEGATNGSTVTVTLTLENATSVLLVPAEALVSHIDGSYAVQLETADETTRWLTVEVIGVTGSNVAIRGDGLTDGTAVLLPL
jgi:Putative peptidoglycan binding domain